MKALTLTQPWAGLVASGIKLVENRPRAMIKSADFGKQFAIHASREISKAAMRTIVEIAPELCTLPDPPLRWTGLAAITGAVIAVATLADALYIGGNNEATTAKMLDKAFGVGHDQARWTFGPTCYVLRDVRALATPIPCKGSLGFWRLPDEVADKVRGQS